MPLRLFFALSGVIGETDSCITKDVKDTLGWR